MCVFNKLVLEREKKGKKKKYLEIRDILCEKEDCQSNMKLQKEMIFVRISILVLCNKKIFESCKSFLFLLEERKNGVLGILSGRVF